MVIRFEIQIRGARLKYFELRWNKEIAVLHSASTSYTTVEIKHDWKYTLKHKISWRDEKVRLKWFHGLPASSSAIGEIPIDWRQSNLLLKHDAGNIDYRRSTRSMWRYREKTAIFIFESIIVYWHIIFLKCSYMMEVWEDISSSFISKVSLWWASSLSMNIMSFERIR